MEMESVRNDFDKQDQCPYCDSTYSTKLADVDDWNLFEHILQHHCEDFLNDPLGRNEKLKNIIIKLLFHDYFFVLSTSRFCPLCNQKYIRKNVGKRKKVMVRSHFIANHFNVLKLKLKLFMEDPCLQDKLAECNNEEDDSLTRHTREELNKRFVCCDQCGKLLRATSLWLHKKRWCPATKEGLNPHRSLEPSTRRRQWLQQWNKRIVCCDHCGKLVRCLSVHKKWCRATKKVFSASRSFCIICEGCGCYVSEVVGKHHREHGCPSLKANFSKKCEDCGKVFTRIEDYTRHQRYYCVRSTEALPPRKRKGSSGRVELCPFCGNGYYHLIYHWKNCKNKPADFKPPKKKKQTKGLKVACINCNLEVPVDTLRRHQKTYCKGGAIPSTSVVDQPVYPNIECKGCGVTITAFSARSHGQTCEKLAKLEGREIFIHKCLDCDLRFNAKPKLVMHRFKIHGIKETDLKREKPHSNSSDAIS